MKIIRLEVWPVEMALSEPYTVAYQSFDRLTSVFLRIVTDRGAGGLGCASPDGQVTGETPESVTTALAGPVTQALTGADPLRPVMLLERLKRAGLAATPGAMAAVDMALYDLLAREAGLPLWRLLGGYRRRIMTSVTIGILPLDQTLAKAAELIGRGFKSLKLKGGRDAAGDAERVVKVRELVGPQVQLRFDANQGFDLEDSIRFIQLSRPAGLELLEQPTARRRGDLMARVTRYASIPVMADESILGLGDAYRLAKRDVMDMVNVKLMKVGGILESLAITSVARAARLEVMVGCMDEPALGIAAGLALALARPAVEYADLDGHLDLVDDPTAGAVILKDGTLHGGDRPGLGVDLP